METCDFCSNKVLILVSNNWCSKPDNYCNSCYLEYNEISKIAGIEDKNDLSQENPIILIIKEFFKKDSFCHGECVYVFFRKNLKQDFLNILDKENSIIDSFFFQDCNIYNEIKRYIENNNTIREIISRYRNFDKIIEVKNFRIKYITKEQFFIKYV